MVLFNFNVENCYILEICFFGDFFIIGDFYLIEVVLVGVEYSVEVIKVVLSKVDIEQNFSVVLVDEFIVLFMWVF